MDTKDAVEENSVKVESNTPRGPSKSGRWWKDEHKNRHSNVIKSKPLKSSWEKKQDERAKKKQVKLMQQEIRDKLQNEKQEKIQRAKEQEQRRLENEKKGEIVQVIRNTAKLKSIKKKQLRTIQKRDITNI